MVAPWVIPAALGVGQTVLGIAGQRSATNAQNAQIQAEWDYRNQVAQNQYNAQAAQYQDAIRFQAASDKYARWAAAFNAGVTDVNNQYQYWQQTVNYNQQKSYINSLRNIELTRAINQAKVVRENRVGAMLDYSRQSDALGQALEEEYTRDSIALYQYHVQAAKAIGDVRNTGREGPVIDRMFGDYARQVGDMEMARQINEGFRSRQYTREQAAQVAGYLSRYNSQTFYEKQPYETPIRPFAPLPTLIAPPPPSSTGPGPTAPVVAQAPQANGGGSLGVLGSVLGGVNTALGAWQNLQQFTGGGGYGSAFPNYSSSLGSVSFNPGAFSMGGSLAPGASGFTAPSFGSAFAP